VNAGATISEGVAISVVRVTGRVSDFASNGDVVEEAGEADSAEQFCADVDSEGRDTSFISAACGKHGSGVRIEVDTQIQDPEAEACVNAEAGLVLLVGEVVVVVVETSGYPTSGDAAVVGAQAVENGDVLGVNTGGHVDYAAVVG